MSYEAPTWANLQGEPDKHHAFGIMDGVGSGSCDRHTASILRSSLSDIGVDCDELMLAAAGGEAQADPPKADSPTSIDPGLWIDVRMAPGSRPRCRGPKRHSLPVLPLPETQAFPGESAPTPPSSSTPSTSPMPPSMHPFHGMPSSPSPAASPAPPPPPLGALRRQQTAPAATICRALQWQGQGVGPQHRMQHFVMPSPAHAPPPPPPPGPPPRPSAHAQPPPPPGPPPASRKALQQHPGHYVAVGHQGLVLVACPPMPCPGMPNQLHA